MEYISIGFVIFGRKARSKIFNIPRFSSFPEVLHTSLHGMTALRVSSIKAYYPAEEILKAEGRFV